METTNVIYMYTNKINGHKYIGQTIDFVQRHKQHIHGHHQDISPIDSAFIKYGEDAFDVQILEAVPHLKGQFLTNYLNALEIFYIEKYNTFKDTNHYNLTKGGDGGLGRKHSKESIQKIRKWQQNKTYELSTLHKLSKSNGNSTGFFRVSKMKDPTLRQGFRWVYKYRENSLRKRISRINFYDLKEAVISQGLNWEVIDENLANKTLKEVGM